MSALKLCPTCNTEYPANERFCPKDGTALRSQDATGDLLGTIIADRYHVLSKLGQGGMGAVYLAEHVKMGRKSAVKVMNPGMVNDADSISRFNREASNASRINHPNVAGIYDFGETADGLIFLAMEYVEGEPLTALVEQQGALPPARAAEIVRQTGEALSVAHEMGIVHRDLKPDNIMITRARDGSDCVKVVDFGIAKAASNESQKVTRTGLIVGTPEYMSPEQLAGDPLDGRSDIYALGLVAFNLLTGKLPFPSETAQESMIMRLTDRPKTLAEQRPQVTWSPDVQTVMDRALERDVAHRYGSAAEFGQALKSAVTRMPAADVESPRSAPAIGARAAQAAPPATRVDSGAVRATAEVGSSGRRRALMGAAAVLVIGGGAWAVSRMDTPVQAAAGPAAAADTGAAATAARPGPAESRPLASAGRDSLASGAALTSRAPGSKIVEAERPPVVGRAAGSAPAAEVPAASAVNVAERLTVLLGESTDDATAERARQEATRLMPLAVGEQMVGLSLVQANALALQEKDAASCSLLRSVQDRAKGTRYEVKVNDLLESC